MMPSASSPASVLTQPSWSSCRTPQSTIAWQTARSMLLTTEPPARTSPSTYKSRFQTKSQMEMRNWFSLAVYCFRLVSCTRTVSPWKPLTAPTACLEMWIVMISLASLKALGRWLLRQSDILWENFACAIPVVDVREQTLTMTLDWGHHKSAWMHVPRYSHFKRRKNNKKLKLDSPIDRGLHVGHVLLWHSVLCPDQWLWGPFWMCWLHYQQCQQSRVSNWWCSW